MSGDFIDRTTATGVLLIVYSLDNDSDIQYITSIRSTDKDSDKNIDIHVNVTDSTGLEYGVAVFALENGLPFPRVVTSPTVIVNAADNENKSICNNNFAHHASIIILCYRKNISTKTKV